MPENRKADQSFPDISDRADSTLSDDTLLASEECYRSAFEQSMEAILLSEPGGLIINANKTACTMFGMTVAEFRLAGYSGIMDTEDQRFAPALEERARTGRVDAELTCIRKNGERFAVEVRSVILQNSQQRSIVCIRDISERKLIEAKLHESEARYRAVVEDQTEVITRYRPDNTYTFVNEVYCRLFGKTSKDLIGAKWYPAVVTEDLPLIEKQLNSMSPANPVVVIENRVYVASGEIRWMQFVNRGFYDDQGQLLETQAVGRDITERKLLEAILEENEARLAAIFHSNPVAIGFNRLDNSRYIEVNQAFLTLFGFCREEVLGHTALELELWPFAEEREELIRLLAEHGRVMQFEARYRHRSGRIGHLLISSELLTLYGQQYMLGMLSDITERKQNEALLLELNGKLRSMSEHLLTIQERERLTIARDIHDELGQQLSSLKFDIAWIEARVEATASGIRERLDEMNGSIDLLVGSIQQIASKLRPPLLDHLGLAAAIEWQANEFTRRSGIECIMMLNEDADPGNLQTATSIIRIVQEALTNVLRHSGATEVDISLCKFEHELLLEISDNGCGVRDREITAEKSYGLAGMLERAVLCGGSLIIKGSPGTGTKLSLTVPVTKGADGP